METTMRGILSKNVPVLVASAAVLAGACSQPVFAQTARSGGSSGQNAQLVQQLQQLGSERTALQAEQAKLKKSWKRSRKSATR